MYSRPSAGRALRLAVCGLLLATAFAGGAAVGARRPDWLPARLRAPEPPDPTPRAPTLPTGAELLAELDAHLRDLSAQVAAAERAEREATVARNLLRQQGTPADADAVLEQERVRAREAARKADLTAQRTDCTKLRSELLGALDREPSPANANADLTTRARTFVIRQELLHTTVGTVNP